MSSLYREGKGFTVQVRGADRRRRSIRMGTLSPRRAEEIKAHLDELEFAVLHGQEPTAATRLWLTRIDAALHQRVSNAGLCTPREARSLGPFFAEWLEARRLEVKPGTILCMRQAERVLVEWFGMDRDLRSITPHDAEDWSRWMRHERSRKLSEATARKRCAVASQAFEWARKRGLVESNPFAESDVKTGPIGNAKRQHYIDATTAKEVIDELPNAQWRALFALARFAGLRVPSEPKELRWDDIDWEKRSIHVQSPKTEHHEGMEQRMVPLFPRLEPYLRDAFEVADEGEPFVFPMLHDRQPTALRKPLIAAIKRAGHTPWPRLFQNLRSSCETDLHAKYPLASVCKWIGNSPSTASKHYLTSRDLDFLDAIANDPFVEVVQIPVQHRAAPQRADTSDVKKNRTGTHENAPVRVSMSPA